MYNEGIKYFRKVLAEKADLYNFQNVGLPFGKYGVGCKKRMEKVSRIPRVLFFKDFVFRMFIFCIETLVVFYMYMLRMGNHD